jgi:hypothetical protein
MNGITRWALRSSLMGILRSSSAGGGWLRVKRTQPGSLERKENPPSILCRSLIWPVYMNPAELEERSQLTIMLRLREAFITRASEFIACCLDNTEPPMRLRGVVNALRLVVCCKRVWSLGRRSSVMRPAGASRRRTSPSRRSYE